MDISVRRIEPDDGPLLAELRLRALADAPYAFSTTLAEASQQTDDDWAELARRRADGDREAAFFAYLGEHPVGMVAGYAHDDARPVDLISMWVDPGARRRGAARALIQAVVDWARQAGHDELQLWVSEVNAGARALYEASGFVGTADVDLLRPGSTITERRMTLRFDPR